MQTVIVRDTRTGRVRTVPATHLAVFPHLVLFTGQDETPPPSPPDDPLGDSTTTATMPLLGRGGHTP